MSLLKMSFAGAVIILIVIIMRSLIMHKLPKRAFLVFWDITMARLLIPFYVPVWISGRVPLKWPRINFPVNEAGLDPGIEMLDVGSIGDGINLVKRCADSFVIRRCLNIPLPDTLFIRFSFWGTVWLIGSLLIAAFFFFSYIKWQSKFKESIPVHNEFADGWLSEHKLKRKLEIRSLDRIFSPLSYGILNPVILMPKHTDWSDAENLKYVFAHEYVHIRYFDAVMKFFLIVSVCVHWFNPFVWIMYVLANRDIELACDESVIRIFGDNTRSSYVMMLIKMQEARNVFAPIANNFNKNALRTRVDAIIRMNKSSNRMFYCICTLMAFVVMMLSTVVKAQPKVSSDEFFRFPLSEINNDNVVEMLNADGIDTNSNQYKAVVKEMTEGLAEDDRKEAYVNNIGIKNLMQNYDDDGDYMVNGIAGLLVTEENIDNKNRIIPIPESSREEMFELIREEIIREKGIANGDTTYRSDVYHNMYLQIEKADRLAAGHTLGEYERVYARAMFSAILAVNPEWKTGDDIPKGALEKLNRKDIEGCIISDGQAFQYIDGTVNK